MNMFQKPIDVYVLMQVRQRTDLATAGLHIESVIEQGTDPKASR